MIGLAAVAAGIAASSTVAIGVGRWLVATHHARPDARSAIALYAPLAPQPWNAPANIGRAAQLAIVASLAPPPAPAPAVALVPAPVPAPAAEPAAHAALALAMADVPLTPDETIVTGSLSPRTFQLASVDPTPAVPAGLLAPRPEAPPSPRARPRLAALTPPTDLGLDPDRNAVFRKTAIYDITAKVVYLPNGERLEAHSGLGRYMDNPAYTRLRMRGSTPPNTYRLKLREALFHGVQAIRLLPENEADMFGRDGILAHTYMLGPTGQSNGCVSFKDYPRFLRAFLRGEIDRIVVVARLDKLPTSFARRDTKPASAAF